MHAGLWEGLLRPLAWVISARDSLALGGFVFCGFGDFSELYPLGNKQSHCFCNKLVLVADGGHWPGAMPLDV